MQPGTPDPADAGTGHPPQPNFAGNHALTRARWQRPSLPDREVWGPWGSDYPRNWGGGVSCQPAPRFRGAALGEGPVVVAVARPISQAFERASYTAPWPWASCRSSRVRTTFTTRQPVKG